MYKVKIIDLKTKKIVFNYNYALLDNAEFLMFSIVEELTNHNKGSFVKFEKNSIKIIKENLQIFNISLEKNEEDNTNNHIPINKFSDICC